MDDARLEVDRESRSCSLDPIIWTGLSPPSPPLPPHHGGQGPAYQSRPWQLITRRGTVFKLPSPAPRQVKKDRPTEATYKVKEWERESLAG